MSETPRWQQRFQNFHKSYEALKRTMAIKNPSEAERGGMIQFFEVTFELSWKLLKDYLEENGYSPKSPKETLKQAHQAEIIQDGRTWLEALENRNLTTHIYDEEVVKEVIKSINNSYFALIESLHAFFSKKIK